MSEQPHRTPASTARPMLAAFPNPGPLVQHAYRELYQAMNGTVAQVKALGDLAALPRPWDPPSCLDPALRAELWAWLDQVVAWLNHEYVWAADAMIPACWPHHPHLVAEVAVLADLRRQAGLALTGDAMEEWHRYALPAFYDRMRRQLGPGGCNANHDPWPAAGAYKRHQAAPAADERARRFAADVATLATPARTTSAPTRPGRHPHATELDEPPEPPTPGRPRLLLIDGQQVDPVTGELLD